MSMRTFLEYVQAGNYKKTPESLHTYRLQEAGKNWIQKANIKKGALHKELGIPEDEKIPTGKLTKFAVAMPDQYKVECSVESYRNYYRGEKAYFAKWKNRDTPVWWE